MKISGPVQRLNAELHLGNQCDHIWGRAARRATWVRAARRRSLAGLRNRQVATHGTCQGKMYALALGVPLHAVLVKCVRAR